MFTGTAIGGPRAGVKLSAPVTWNGKVRRSSGSAEHLSVYYIGHYFWSTTQKTWVWTDTPHRYEIECVAGAHVWPAGDVILGAKCVCGRKMYMWRRVRS